MRRHFDPMRRHLLKVLAGGLAYGFPLRHAFADTEPRRVEIAVVGAGLFGASTAMHLAADGVRSVALVGPSEVAGSRSPAQHFASHYDESRNATAMDADPAWAELALESVEPLRALEKRTGMEIFSEMGSLRVTQGALADGYFDLVGIRKTAKKLSVGLVELGSDALLARYPDARFDADSLGLLQETRAGVIRPRRLAAAMRRVALEEGATWIDDEVARIDPKPEHVDLFLGSGARVRARHVLVATGAAPIGHALISEQASAKVATHAHRPTHIEVPDGFSTTLPPVMMTSSGDGEFFGGFVAPPLRYPDGRRYIKVAGQGFSLVDREPSGDQVKAAVRAVRRLFPSLEPGAVLSQVCMTTDSESTRPIIEWVDSRVAVALAGNGKGAKAAMAIGRRAATMIASPRRA